MGENKHFQNKEEIKQLIFGFKTSNTGVFKEETLQASVQ